MKTDYVGGSSAPAQHVFVVVPDDDDPLPVMPKAIRAGGDGTIVLRAIGSGADVAHPVRNGEVIPAIVSHIRATGTDVSVIGYA